MNLRWAMNDPKHAVVFITTCLNFDSKIQVIDNFSLSLADVFLGCGRGSRTSCDDCRAVRVIEVTKAERGKEYKTAISNN